MNSRTLQIVLASILPLGCSSDPSVECGPGTSLIGGTCVPTKDGGVQDGSGADGGASLLTLGVDEPLVLVRNARLCLTGEQLAIDGSRVPVELTGVAPASSAVVRPADPLDCEGVGLIAGAPGTTSVEITADSAARTVEVLVVPGLVSIEAADVVVPVGGQARFDIRARAQADAEDITLTPNQSFAPSLLEASVVDASIAAIDRGESSGWPMQSETRYPRGFIVRGLGRGESTVSVSYAGELQEPASVVVSGAATSASSPVIRYTLDGERLGVPFALRPSTCVDAEIWAWLQDDGGASWYARLDEPAWEVDGDAVRLERSASTATLCATEVGDVGVRACANVSGMEVCASSGLAVYDAADVVALEAVTNGAALERVDALGQRVCPDIRIQLRFRDGLVVDVTHSAALTWGPSSEAPFTPWDVFVVDGAPYLEGGHLCFTTYGAADVPNIALEAVYGDLLVAVSVPLVN